MTQECQDTTHHRAFLVIWALTCGLKALVDHSLQTIGHWVGGSDPPVLFCRLPTSHGSGEDKE
jgi:hypothetical protein